MKTETKKQKNSQKKKTKSGFTLVEVLLYVVIAATMLTAFSFFLQMILEARIKNQTIAEVEQQGAQVMQMITQSIRNSQSINTPTAGAPGASMSLAETDLAKNPTVFNLSAGVAQMQEGASAIVPLTSSRVVISALNFQNLSRTGTSGTARIQFTVTHINPSGKYEYNYQETFTASASIHK